MVYLQQPGFLELRIQLLDVNGNPLLKSDEGKDDAKKKLLELKKLKEDGINIYTVRNTSDGDFQKGSHIGEDLYEMNGFIVHFFSDEKIKKLLNGYKNLEIIRFDEGNFPRRLSMVINQKTS